MIGCLNIFSHSVTVAKYCQSIAGSILTVVADCNLDRVALRNCFLNWFSWINGLLFNFLSHVLLH